jgi:hypothetical protein
MVGCGWFDVARVVLGGIGVFCAPSVAVPRCVP